MNYSRALLRAFAQFSDPRFRKVVWLSLAFAVGAFVVLWGGTWALIEWGLSSWVGGDGDGWWSRALGYAIDASAVVAGLITSFLLFPAMVTLTMGMLLDDIAQAVEDRHYPSLPPARVQRVREVLGDTARLALLTVVVNLLFLPIYLLVLWFPPLNLFVFYGVNGYLLNREYFEMVAVRRLTRPEIRSLRRRHWLGLFGAGIIVALLLTLPVLNLVMPIVATGFMVHLLEGYRRRGTDLAETSA